MDTIGSFAATDVYFAATWFAFCIGAIVGFILAGGFESDKGPDQEDQEDADEGA